MKTQQCAYHNLVRLFSHVKFWCKDDHWSDIKSKLKYLVKDFTNDIWQLSGGKFGEWPLKFALWSNVWLLGSTEISSHAIGTIVTLFTRIEIIRVKIIRHMSTCWGERGWGEKGYGNFVIFPGKTLTIREIDTWEKTLKNNAICVISKTHKQSF